MLSESRQVLLFALLVGLVYQVFLPPFLGEDEPWHLEAAEWVAQGHLPRLAEAHDAKRRTEVPLSLVQVLERYPAVDLPQARAVQERILDALEQERVFERIDWAENPGGARSFDAIHLGISGTQQPPVYPVLVGTWLRACPTEDPVGRLRFARVLSLFAYLIVVRASYALAARMGNDCALLAALIVALWPMHARQAATVNPDVLANALVASAVWLAVAWQHSRPALGLSMTLALALAAPFVKSTALSAWVVPLAIVIGFLSRSKPGLGVRKWLLVGILAGGFTVVALFALRNSPVLPETLEDTVVRLEKGLSTRNLSELLRTSVGVFGWGSRPLPPPGRVLFSLGLALSVAGWLRVRASDRFAVGLGAALVAFQGAAVVWRGAAAGRYLHPALPGTAMLLAVGWLGLSSGRHRRLGWWVAVFALFTWHGCALFFGPLGVER